jgi:hypothetical protein
MRVKTEGNGTYGGRGGKIKHNRPVIRANPGENFGRRGKIFFQYRAANEESIQSGNNVPWFVPLIGPRETPQSRFGVKEVKDCQEILHIFPGGFFDNRTVSFFAAVQSCVEISDKDEQGWPYPILSRK